VTGHEPGGRSRYARPSRVVPIILGALAIGSAALASDGDLQRLLLENGCIEPRIEIAMQQRDLVAYRANCLGTSHKTIVIVCRGGRCSPSPPINDRDR